LNGLFTDITPNGDRTGMMIIASPDLYNFGHGAAMLHFIKATLAAGELAGNVTFPEKLKVDMMDNGHGVFVHWG